MSKHKLIQDLIRRYSDLEIVSKDIEDAYELLKNSFENSGKLLICGNGGSASDGDHIVGELMKRFSIPRAIPKNLKSVLVSDYGEKGKYMSEKLEGALPAISLNAHSTLSSAFANDVDAELIYAQQVVGYVGRDGGEFNKYCDVLINVGGDCTPQIQELHLPIYHVLCQTLEYHFFSETK